MVIFFRRKLKTINAHLLIFFFQGEFLLLDNFELVTEVEFGGLLLELGEFVLVFGNLLESGLDAERKISFIASARGSLITRYLAITYNLPRRSLTWAFRSEIYL